MLYAVGAWQAWLQHYPDCANITPLEFVPCWLDPSGCMQLKPANGQTEENATYPLVVPLAFASLLGQQQVNLSVQR